jgi:hypothetical protein
MAGHSYSSARELGGSGDAVHLTIAVLEREEPVVRRVPLVESVIHRAAVTERPRGLAILVDTRHAVLGRAPIREGLGGVAIFLQTETAQRFLAGP